MPRNLACALLIGCADVLIGAAHWPHFTGGSLLLILAVDAALILGFAWGPFIRTHRSIDLLQADALAGAPRLYWRGTSDPRAAVTRFERDVTHDAVVAWGDEV